MEVGDSLLVGGVQLQLLMPADGGTRERLSIRSSKEPVKLGPKVDAFAVRFSAFCCVSLSRPAVGIGGLLHTRGMGMVIVLVKRALDVVASLKDEGGRIKSSHVIFD